MFSEFAFRLEISKEIGLGHYKRLLVLKKKINLKPIWIISGDKNIIHKLFKKKKFFYIKDFKSEIQNIVNLKKIGVTKIVFDIANNNFINNNKNLKTINLYRKNNFKTISFDLPKQKKTSDISIIPYDYISKSKPKNNKKTFVGSEYFLYETKFKKNNLSKKIKKILISIGGSDYKNIGIEILKILSNEKFSIKLLSGLNKKIHFKNKKLSTVNFHNKVEKYYKWCDIVICGEGITKFEAINHNKPVILIHQYDVFSNLIKTFLKQQTCLSLGLYNKKKLNFYKNQIISYINNKCVQIKHMKNQRKIFNKSSIFIKQKRLMEEIRKL